MINISLYGLIKETTMVDKFNKALLRKQLWLINLIRPY